MEDGVATVSFSTGMAAIAAVTGLAGRRRPHRVESILVRQHQQPVPDARVPRNRREPGRRDRRRRSRASTYCQDTPRVRGNHRQSAYPGCRPGPDRDALRGARPLVRRRQHDDLAVAVPAETGGGWSRRQRADQVHRRPRQRARWKRHRHRSFRLDRLSQHPSIAAPIRDCGHHAAPQEGACAISAARCRPSRRTIWQSARRRSPCA